MAEKTGEADAPASRVDLVLRSLVKGQRTAQAVLRVLPFGSELRINVDGELCCSDVERSDVRALSAHSAKHHQGRVIGVW